MGIFCGLCSAAAFSSFSSRPTTLGVVLSPFRQNITIYVPPFSDWTNPTPPRDSGFGVLLLLARAVVDEVYVPFVDGFVLQVYIEPHARPDPRADKKCSHIPPPPPRIPLPAVRVLLRAAVAPHRRTDFCHGRPSRTTPWSQRPMRPLALVRTVAEEPQHPPRAKPESFVEVLTAGGKTRNDVALCRFSLLCLLVRIGFGSCHHDACWASTASETIKSQIVRRLYVSSPYGIILSKHVHVYSS